MNSVLWPTVYRERASLKVWLGRSLHWTGTGLAVLIGGLGIVATSVALLADDATYQRLSEGVVPSVLFGFAMAGVVYTLGRLFRHLLSRE